VSAALLTICAVLLVAAAAVALYAGRAWRALRREREAARVAGRADGIAEERRRAAFERFPGIALVVDDRCRIVEANASALARFPFLRPGLALLDAFTEHELAGRASTALATGTPEEFQVRLFAGGRRTYRVTVSPYPLPEGAEALVFLNDLSEAVAYQELRSQFVANVSHELRTPLTGLGALLEALEDPGMDVDTQTRFVSRARRETERLEALITDILFLSELEATQGIPSGERADLRQAALAAAEALAEAAADHGVTLAVEAPRPVWAPLTDRMARTVVGNLLENAVKYAGPGARATVGVRAEGPDAIIEVADDGAGIPERHLPHVFERFYRADPSRSKRLGGTGLGLSIVKHIAERFGGTAEATSREGFGTTVRVAVPLAPPAGVPAPVDGVSEESAAPAP
jgi:signal transduction histidine kinase